MANDTAAKIALIKSHIGDFRDFPKPGIIFKDIFTALTKGEVCVALKDVLVDYVKSTCPKIDVIVGLDARGFLFGFLLAAELGISFVPVRKRGKLPGQCISHEYSLEYGTDAFEMQANSIRQGQSVVIVDDLLATGGSMTAARELVQKAGGVVEKIVVIIELTSLNGRTKLPANIVHSLIQFD